MKKLYELSKFEAYEYIFKPLFNYSIDRYIEYGWDIEKMINGEWTPTHFFPHLHKSVLDKFTKRKESRNSGGSIIEPLTVLMVKI